MTRRASSAAQACAGLWRNDAGMSGCSKFTPRRPGSAWSKRNVAIATPLVEEGRMRPSGLAAVSRAKADGTWHAAYEGQATIGIPADLAPALAGDPVASAMFDKLNASNRYAILYRVTTAKRADTRRRRIEQFVAMLARGETIHRKRSSRPAVNLTRSGLYGTGSGRPAASPASTRCPSPSRVASP